MSIQLDSSTHQSCIHLQTEMRWTHVMRRGLSQHKTSMRLVESWDELLVAASECPDASISIEIELARLSKWVDRVCTLAQRFPNAALVALLSRKGDDAEWVFREAGCCHVVTSPRAAHEACLVMLRHLNRHATSPVNLKQQIFQQLPWSES